MKLPQQTEESLTLADLEQICGGAGLHVFRSDTELARLGRGLQQYAGARERLDVWQVRTALAPGPTLVAPPLPESNEAFDVQQPEQYARRLEAR